MSNRLLENVASGMIKNQEPDRREMRANVLLLETTMWTMTAIIHHSQRYPPLREITALGLCELLSSSPCYTKKKLSESLCLLTTLLNTVTVAF